MDDQANLAFFSSPHTVIDYARAAVNVGLWESEKFVFGKFISPNAKLLELGSGAGRVSFALLKNGYTDLTVTDFSPEMVEMAQSVFGEASPRAKFSVEDATKLTFGDEVFDAVIFAFNGLQMIPKRSRREAAIAEVFRVLKPGGVFIFTGHDRTHPLRVKHWAEERIRWDAGTQNRELEEFGDSYYTTPHGRVFIHSADPEELRGELERVGFQVVLSELRSRISTEPEAVLEFSDDTRFWVCKK